MSTAARYPDQSAARHRCAELSVVRDGDGYVLGSPHSPDYVAVPDIGGKVVLWLQSGCSVEECADRAENVAGEPVDITGFLAGLTAAGLLRSEDSAAPAAVARSARDTPHGWALGHLLFGGPGLAVQGALAGAGLVLLIIVPALRPHFTDAIVTGVPLLSMLLVAVLAIASGLVHEYAHVLAAAARGVSGRVSISRRMISIVYQTDLTRLWSVPRSARVVPLLAGIISDAATVGVLLIGQMLLPDDAPSLVVALIRTMIFIKITGLVFQTEIYMRTDLYALFVVVTGCRNLWATKGALARRTIRTATAEDLAVLTTAGRREIFWARVYLLLYVPGVAWTVWYFTTFVLPALHRIILMALDAIMAHGLVSGVGVAGAVALVLTVASLAFVLWGVARTVVRLLLRILTTTSARSRRNSEIV